MRHRLLLTGFILTVGLSAGCVFSKKSAAPKANAAPAAETEQELRQRFVEKRTAELVAAGQNADAARAQALAEFRERYGYTTAAQK